MKRTLSKIWLFIMQKWLIIPIIVALLAGVAFLVPRFSRYPEQADDGMKWDRSWEMLGTVLGVEAPGNGLTLLNNDTILAGDDTYYASWVLGQSTKYVNAEGKDVDLYPLQIYLLLYGCADADAAAAALADFTAREEATYEIRTREEAVYNGQPYSLLIYNCGSETNPYSRGVSAFSRFGQYALIAECTVTDDFSGDEQAVLADFLSGCHFSTANLK